MSQTLRGLRVAVLEDNALLAFALEEELGDHGAVLVASCASGAELQRAVSERAVDCAVLDMSVRDGLSIGVAGWLRERGVQLVFVTGYGAPPGLPSALRDVPILQKPAAPGALIELLASIARRGDCARSERE